MLTIIGFLLGGVFKAQALINSAHVRSLADTTVAVQTAYLGFMDRYRRIPGDWSALDAGNAIGVPLVGGGNDNGRLDNPPGGALFAENNALWEQLQQAGFIRGNYLGAADEPTTDNSLAPLNAFNTVMLVGRTDDYLSSDGPSSVRLNVVVGRGVPAGVLRELDVKLDDGRPGLGTLRSAVADGDVNFFTGSHQWGGSSAECTYSDAAGTHWNVVQQIQDCNGVYLF
ncbi:MAG: hypothetical protein KDK91_21705 [Gammaproteobacteria bacterium]|nr:hypothetical protein [Gammaproteobacteria bacterium]